MAISKKSLNEKFKMKVLEMVSNFLKEEGEDVLRVKSGEICFPFVNEAGDDEWLKMTFSVPAGSREGEPYDGYGEAESYEMGVASKKKKAEEAALAKAKKIKKDAAVRAKKAAQKKKEEEE